MFQNSVPTKVLGALKCQKSCVGKAYLFGILQSLTRKCRDLQGNPCNKNRDPAMRAEVPCNKNRFFPVRIELQGLGLQCSLNHELFLSRFMLLKIQD